MSTETELPTTADGYKKDLLTTLQLNYRLQMDGPDIGTQAERTLRTVTICDRFSAVMFLHALQTVDSALADKVAAQVCGIIADGSEVGSYIFDMLEKMGIDPDSLTPPADPRLNRKRYWDLIKGLDILSEYDTDGEPTVDHDQIWAGGDASEVPAYHAHELEQLGWTVDTNIDRYTKNL